MLKPSLSDLNAFLPICAHRSFRNAADELGVAPSTLSHAIRALKRSRGVRLFNKSTRSVSPTEAGTRLADQLRPALRDVDQALVDVDSFRERPGGTLRINASPSAARVLFADVIPAFRLAYPNVTLDLVAESALVDVVEEGFDAGIRLLEAVPHYMIAIPIAGDTRFLAVGAGLRPSDARCGGDRVRRPHARPSRRGSARPASLPCRSAGRTPASLA